MKKNLTTFLCFVSLHFFCIELHAATPLANANITSIPQEDLAIFNPPSGWMAADRSKVDLPPLVKIMVVGKPASTFPPSMNLTSAPYEGTLKQYLQIVKNRNQQNKNVWKDLGTIQTQAGKASLSQVDSKSQWGDLRQMHVILVKNKTVYILTAAALKNEFSLYYQDFFKAMSSFRVSNNPLDIITDQIQKNELQNEIKKVHTKWTELASQDLPTEVNLSWQEKQERVFNSIQFKTQAWTPFEELLQRKFADLGSDWQTLVKQNVKNELFNLNRANKKN